MFHATKLQHIKRLLFSLTYPLFSICQTHSQLLLQILFGQLTHQTKYLFNNKLFSFDTQNLMQMIKNYETCIRIRMQVAKRVVPQYIGRCPNVLRNHLFRNMYTDPYTYCGIGGSATKIKIIKLKSLKICQGTTCSVIQKFTLFRNRWFRNTIKTITEWIIP